MQKVYLNGQFLSPDEACIPVTDRGLLFGDSVYEVIPAYAGVPFRAQQHLDRLQRSLDAIRLHNPMNRQGWLDMIAALCSDCPGHDQSIYIQVTRGAYPTRSHRLPDKANPNVIAFVSPIPERDPRVSQEGLRAITLPDIRWHHCDIKTTNLLANILAQAEAVERQADDAIFIRNGIAREGTASNLFIVLDGLLITPPNSDELLPGITRDLVLELAAAAGIAHTEARVSEQDLRAAEEVWLTSSTREIAPVVQLDGRAVGNARPGPHWQAMEQLFQAEKQRIRLQALEKRND